MCSWMEMSFRLNSIEQLLVLEGFHPMSFDIKQKIIRIDILLIFKTDEIVQSRPIAIQRRQIFVPYT